MAEQLPRTGDPMNSVEEIRRLEVAEEAVKRWESWSVAVNGGSYSAELVAAVKELILMGSDGGNYAQRAKLALQAAMGHLEDDFRQVLISGTCFHSLDSLQASPLNNIAFPVQSFSFSLIPNLKALSVSSFTTSSSDDSRSYRTGYSRDSMSMEKVHLYLIDPEASILLKEIAELMILAGNTPNLCHVYGETRHSTLMQCLCLLGVQVEPKHCTPELAEGGFQLYGQRLKMWIQALKVIVGTVLPEERQACSKIFGCDSKLEEDCFVRATMRCIHQLVAIGNVVTDVKKQQYKQVPLLLQMQEELLKLRPSLVGLFSGQAKDVISHELSMLLHKLRESTYGLLLEFLNVWLNNEPYKEKELDGGITSLTQHVIGFIKPASEFSDTLNLILQLQGEEGEDGIRETKRPWESYVQIVFARLQLKIEEKSKSYKDEGLRYIFLMNNAMHNVEASRSMDLRVSLGGDIHKQLDLRVEEYATAYLRTTWAGPVSFLTEPERTQTTSSSLKNLIKNFNSAFGEIIRVQTTWKVPNPQLRQHLRIVIALQVSPAYRAFIGRYVCHFEQKYQKYTTEDIENHVSDLFEG